MALKKKVGTVQKVVKKTVTVTAKNVSTKRGDYIAAVGRRKLSVARVRLYRGSGTSEVNQKPLDTFFGAWVDRGVAQEPLMVTETAKGMYFTAKVLGGGTKGQAKAISHALARALVKTDEEYKKVLRAKGLLTRDPRMRETRKIGTGGKARRAKQSPKR